MCGSPPHLGFFREASGVLGLGFRGRGWIYDLGCGASVGVRHLMVYLATAT